MAWEQYVIETEAGSLEQVEQSLFACGALSVSLEDAGDTPILEPAPGETPLWPRMRVRALFAAGATRDGMQARLLSVLPPGAVAEVEQIADADWSRAWLAHARPLWFGARLCVAPTELAPDREDAIVVKLDPGLAFGTGSHPSTAACLEWLATADLNDARILDYGCGSGVLAIAACKLGARRAAALDIDPQARTACLDNARGNDCAARVSVLAPNRLAACAYDVVVANILARPLIELAPVFAILVRAGGALVLAGILHDQVDSVLRAHASSFEFAPARQHDGWAMLVGTRHDEPS